MLTRGGAEVLLAGFCRDQDLTPAIAARRPLVLGTSADAAMVQRVNATIRNAVFNDALTTHFADCDLIMARNLEQLAIARTLVGDRPLAYECLDIHRLLVGKGMASRAVQAIEAKLLPRVDLLITSSPAFIENHFAATSLDSQVMLLENKLLVEDMKTFTPVSQAPVTGPVRIGWFGMLRCAKTFEVLKAIASSSAGAIEVLIAGKPSPAIFSDFSAMLASTPGIEFVGPYSYADLPALYGRCHFAWTIDWYEEGENSSWLLPNRIYEAVAYGSIPIALAHIEVGRWLAARNAGLLVSEHEEVTSILATMSPAELARRQKAIALVPAHHVLADDNDCRALVNSLRGIERK